MTNYEKYGFKRKRVQWGVLRPKLMQKVTTQENLLWGGGGVA